MTEHNLNLSPDDCPHCQEGCAPDRIDAVRGREHFHLAAAVAAAANDMPLPLYEQSYASHRAQQPGAQQLPAAVHAPQPTKKATINASAIYAARAKAAAGSRGDALNRSSVVNADSIYAKRRADLNRNQ
jgi:hypothetical protein